MQRTIGLTAFLMLLLSLSFAQAPVWKGRITRENGVTVIHNPREPLYATDAFRLQEELSIGKAEGKGGMRYSVEEDADGYLFAKRYRVIWKSKALEVGPTFFFGSELLSRRYFSLPAWHRKP